MEPICLLDLSREELGAWVAGIGEKPFRAKQIYAWLYRGVASFAEMTDLSKPLREKLTDLAVVGLPEIDTKLVSKLDGTVKYLFRLRDGETVESVVMRYKHGLSICVSSQVGCRMGCTFCASTLGGLVRSLSPGEIVGQLLTAQRDLGERIGHIVLMGMGEPLDNYDAVIKFLKLVNDTEGLGISYRNISLSTCGIVDRIYDLAKEKLPITLSISLHAPFSEMRSRLMPINRKYPLASLMEACRSYTETTSRRISFEYALVGGVNDTHECALALAGLLRGMLCHVNLIPVNPVAERSMERTNPKAIAHFQEVLANRHITVTVRRELGSDINAACGQLRRKQMQASGPGAKAR